MRTAFAVGRQRLFLAHPKHFLPLGKDHMRQLVRLNIAKLIFRIDVVIAGVDVAVFLNRQRLTAKRRGNA